MSITMKEQGSDQSDRKPNVRTSQMFKALIPAALLLTIVFWINSAQLWGIFYQQGNHVSRAHVAVVDFDDGSFGEALYSAAASSNGTYGNPTYTPIDAASTSPEDIRHRVFTGEFWAAVYVHAGASTRFGKAVNGTSDAYDMAQVYTYITMPGRYYTFYLSSVQQSVITVTQSAIGIFSSQTVAPLILNNQHTNTTAAASALAAPARAIPMPATSQDFTLLDDKVFLNTVGSVFPILMQFFFIMAWNGLSNGMHHYAAHDMSHHITLRLVVSIVWPLLASLSYTGWTFAFAGAFTVTAKMFFAFWAVTWVLCMISFDILDFVTGFLPMAFVPFFTVSWIIFSVSAALGPETMLNGWYRIGYFFPGLHWFQTVITILTEGGVNRLYYTLPTLAGWLVVMKVLSPLATRNRVRKAGSVWRYLDEKDALAVPH